MNIRDSCLNGQFISGHFLHNFCFSVHSDHKENLNNECWDNRDSFLG